MDSDVIHCWLYNYSTLSWYYFWFPCVPWLFVVKVFMCFDYHFELNWTCGNYTLWKFLWKRCVAHDFGKPCVKYILEKLLENYPVENRDFVEINTLRKLFDKMLLGTWFDELWEMYLCELFRFFWFKFWMRGRHNMVCVGGCMFTLWS